MNIKTKVVTIVIAAILILPAILNPKRDGGEVLGVSDNGTIVEELVPESLPQEEVEVAASNTSPEVVANTPATIVPQATPENEESFWSRVNIFKRSEKEENKSQVKARIKDISSGIRDVKTVETSTLNSVPKQKIGKIRWEAGTTTNIVSGVYPVGSGVQINYNNNSSELVVNTSRILSPGTLLVVDPATFISLGGDPERESVISVEVIAK